MGEWYNDRLYVSWQTGRETWSHSDGLSLLLRDSQWIEMIFVWNKDCLEMFVEVIGVSVFALIDPR